MDSAKLVLTQPVPQPSLLENLNKIGSISEDKKEQIAKDFESVLINKLLDQMKKTIGDWGFEKDEVSRQSRGIFWLYLARDIANKGGFGIWKDILANSEQTNKTVKSLDSKL